MNTDLVVISSVLITPQVIAFSLFLRAYIYGPRNIQRQRQVYADLRASSRYSNPEENRWEIDALCLIEDCTANHDRVLVLA